MRLAGREFNVQGELTQRRRAKPSAAGAGLDRGGGGGGGGGSSSGGQGGDDAAKRRKTTSVAEHMRQMAAASTEALQRPRKDRERFRRCVYTAATFHM